MIGNPYIKFTIALVFGIVIQHISIAQTISGQITDNEGEGLPFATVYIEGTSVGTNTNTEGSYSLELAPGTYNVIFQYVGYKKVKHLVEISHTAIQYNVKLQPETFQLKEVVVNADQADLAYQIIRNAIKNRKKHKEEIESYTCQVYIKGLQRLDERPSKLLGYTVPLDTGIVYLSESIAQLEVQQPDRVKETMISSKVSGNSSGFSFNQASQTLISFYSNLIKVTGLTERGFISPIANNALFFYKYQLVGTMIENDILINKIRVTPRRKTDPTFEGYIYIVEDQWNLSSIDLTLTKDHQIEFLDEMRIKQVFAPMDNVWLMITQQFNFDIDVWGFKGAGYFAVNYSDYNYILNQKYHKISNDTSTNQNIDPVPTQRFIKKKKTNNEVLKIEVGANKRTDLYWAKHRPVPLTATEKRDYKIKDSLTVIMQSHSYLDTLDKKKNKISINKVLYTGYKYQNSFKETSWRVKPLVNTLQYNTVEGFLVNLEGSYSISQEKKLKHRITPEIRYGFASKDFYSQLQYSWHYNAIKQAKLMLYGGSFVSQINDEAPILPIVNTLETLINRRNYMKLYEKRYFKVHHESELSNGIHLKANIEYAQRSRLLNQSTYSFFYTEDRDFSSNAPVNMENINTSFDTHNALLLTARLVLRINQKYISGPDMKYNLGSKYPDFVLYYRGGIRSLGSDIRFDLIELKIKDSFGLGLLGESKYIIGVGGLVSKERLTFIDFKHFSSNQSIYSEFKRDQFQLLDYYRYSTTKPWLQAHYNHHFNGFIINKLPLIKKSKVQTVVSAHYLKTQSLDNYLELAFGIEHILKVGRLDYTFGIVEGQDYMHGIRFGLGF